MLSRKRLGAAFQLGEGADSTRDHSWRGVQGLGLNPEFGEALKALSTAGLTLLLEQEAGGGGMWPEVWELPLLGPGDPPFLGRLPGDRGMGFVRPQEWGPGREGAV